MEANATTDSSWETDEESGDGSGSDSAESYAENWSTDPQMVDLEGEQARAYGQHVLMRDATLLNRAARSGARQEVPPLAPWLLGPEYESPCMPVEALRLQQGSTSRLDAQAAPLLRRRLLTRTCRKLQRHEYRLLHAEAVHNLTFSPSGHVLVVTCGDGTMSFMDPLGETLVQHRVPAHTEGVNGARFLDDNQFVTGGDDLAVKLWDLRYINAEANPVKIFLGHRGWIKNFEIVGDHIISSAIDPGEICVWSLRTPANENRIVLARNADRMAVSDLTRVAVHSDGSTLALGIGNFENIFGNIVLVHDLNAEHLCADLRNSIPIFGLRKEFQACQPLHNTVTESTFLEAESRAGTTPLRIVNFQPRNRLEFVHEPLVYRIPWSLQFHPANKLLLARQSMKEFARDPSAFDRLSLYRADSTALRLPTMPALRTETYTAAVLGDPTRAQWLEAHPPRLLTQISLDNSRHTLGVIKEVCFGYQGQVFISPYQDGVALFPCTPELVQRPAALGAPLRQTLASAALSLSTEPNPASSQFTLTCRAAPFRNQIATGSIGGGVRFYHAGL